MIPDYPIHQNDSSGKSILNHTSNTKSVYKYSIYYSIHCNAIYQKLKQIFMKMKVKLYQFNHNLIEGAQWLSGRVLDSRPRGREFEPHRRHYIVSLSKNINPNLVRVQPRKTHPFINERLLMGRKESHQTNKQIT